MSASYRAVKPPRKALLLAAGYGTRFRPLSHVAPKPLTPLWNRPVLDRILIRLRDWGVREVLVNLHEQADRIVRHVLRAPPVGLRVQFSFEPVVLGTGGALRRAAWFFGDKPFWLVNTDIAAELSPAPLLREAARGRPVAVLWMEARQGPRTVELDKDGQIRTFRSQTPGAPGTATFCGVQWVAPDIVQWLPTAFSSIVEAYEHALAAGRRVAGVLAPRSFWRDLGEPDAWREAHRAIRDAWRQGRPGASLYDPTHARTVRRARENGAIVCAHSVLAPDADIGAGARIENSIVGPGARIGPRAVLTDALAAEHTVVHGWARGCVVPAARVPLDPSLRRALQALGWPPASVTINPLPARGSDRALTRIERGPQSAIVVAYGSERRENLRYAGHARFLRRHGVPVPRVLADCPRARVCALEDLGPETLLDRLRARPGAEETERLYRRVLDAVLALHSLARRTKTLPKMEPAFSPALYRWERELFADRFLAGCAGLHGSVLAAVREELALVARRLRAAPHVPIHRDMQSSNIMLATGRPVFVDFQGMRMGPAVYDLASLLCDPYVMLGPALRQRLLNYYCERSPDPDSVRRLFPWAAAQRLGQALGAYARLGAEPRTRRFLDCIPPALRMLRRTLTELDELPALRRTVAELTASRGTGILPVFSQHKTWAGRPCHERRNRRRGR